MNFPIMSDVMPVGFIDFQQLSTILYSEAIRSTIDITNEMNLVICKRFFG